VKTISSRKKNSGTGRRKKKGNVVIEHVKKAESGGG